MNLTHDQGTFTLNCTFEERFAAKNAGFKWASAIKKWQTDSPRMAMAFVQFATPDCRVVLERHTHAAKAVLAESMATTADLAVPHPEDGPDYFPFQKAGVKFCLRKDPVRALIGDEMGLGKTCQSIGTLNMREDIRSVLVVCPASLKLNWRRELTMWLTRNLTVGVVSSDKGVPDADILIVNYDILGKACDCKKTMENKKPKKDCPKCNGKGFFLRLPGLVREYDLIITDECHRLKNADTLTFKAFKIIAQSKHRIALSGTPILNRPIEMQTTLGWLDHVEWGDRWQYAQRYCGLVRNRFGVDMSGATNLEELRDRLRSTVMIRRLKRDVMKELPPKIHQIIELPSDGLAEAVTAEWTAYKNQEKILFQLKAASEIAKTAETDAEYQTAMQGLKDGVAASFAQMSYARLDLAKRKIPYIITHLEDTMEDVSKLVAFGHHTEVIDEVFKKMEKFRPVKITGSTSMTARDGAVQAFQNDPSCQFFVGNIIAAGVGLTLTAASTVVLFELDWRPGIVAQAIDRCHRIGQKDSVLAQYLVLEGSLDAYMAKKIAAKQKVIDVALGASDGLSIQEQIELPTQEPAPATESTSRKQIADKALAVRPGDMEVVMQGLRIVASMDADHARGINMVGFSKIDVEIGHSLAERNWLSPKQIVLAYKLCNKYRGQLPDSVTSKLNIMKERLA